MGEWGVLMTIPIFWMGSTDQNAVITISASLHCTYHVCHRHKCLTCSPSPSPDRTAWAVTPRKKLHLQHPRLSEYRDRPEYFRRCLRMVVGGERAGVKMERYDGEETTGGVYFMLDKAGTPLAVFKPAGEEAGVTGGAAPRRGIAPGAGARREYAVSFLAAAAGQRCPVTALVTARPNGGVPQVGALQEYVPSVGSCTDYGPGRFAAESAADVMLLDLRFLNTDRHLGNLLMHEDNSITPIDHTYCLPTTLDEIWYSWLSWPQARSPFPRKFRDQVLHCDLLADVAFLRSVDIEAEAVFNYFLANLVLKAALLAGASPYDLGRFFSRLTLEEPSKLEVLHSDVLEVFPHAVRDPGSCAGSLAAYVSSRLPFGDPRP
mmetsp:Transcript_30755/g.86191  ORF Transcript_30755/g.86191 Transcript_30755/m.86191 type:complete len:376 (+) Transcript_30755:297-1424(+)